MVNVEDDEKEKPVILHDGRSCRGEGLANDEWESHLLLEDPTGSILTAKVHLFMDTQFIVQVVLHWIQPVLLSLEKKAKHVLSRDSCKNRNQSAGQLIDIQWHVSW